MDQLRSDFLATLHSEINSLQRHMVLVLLGANATLSVTIGDLAFAAAKLV